jgi:hypothetical protein
VFRQSLAELVGSLEGEGPLSTTVTVVLATKRQLILSFALTLGVIVPIAWLAEKLLRR